jgi:hypothetical protein
MSQLLVAVVIVVASVIVALVAKRRKPSTFEHFWEDFWPNYFSDLVVGILIAIFLGWVLTAGERIEAKVVLEKISRAESGVNIELVVENTGDVGFRADEIYWHVFIDNRLDIIEKGATVPEPTSIIIKGKPFLSFEELLHAPVFPGRKTRLLTMKVNVPEPGQYVIYYYLSTVHGLFPKPGRIKRETVPNFGMITFDM